MKELRFKQPRLNIRGEFIDWFYWGFTNEGGFTSPVKLHLPNFQYIGLQDMNGVDIYDKDKVECKYMYDSNIDYWLYKPPIFEVIWDKDEVGFRLKPYDYNGIWPLPNVENGVLKYWEIIGNTWEKS